MMNDVASISNRGNRAHGEFYENRIEISRELRLSTISMTAKNESFFMDVAFIYRCVRKGWKPDYITLARG